MNSNTHLKLSYRGGAEIDNPFLREYVQRQIRQIDRPIVFLWFSTCELTKKQREKKFIQLIDNVEDELKAIIQRYRKFKEELLKINNISTILFLECPYYSIPIWNEHKGGKTPENYQNEQKKSGKYYQDT